MLVIKKNRQVKIYIDFKNLNLATSKDEYVMPIVDMLIDAASNHGILTFIDGYLGYNQIFITKSSVHKTTFRWSGLLGVFDWIVMPFGLS